jgi:hypothetical protein
MIFKPNKGFTTVEMLIIAPMVILMISAFISAIVILTGNVLAARGSNDMAFDLQDTLNRMEQDIKLSGGLLTTNNFTPILPQGYGDSTTLFKNFDLTKGYSLILNSYTTNGNPTSAGRDFIYTSVPNGCSNLVNQNNILTYNIVYFVKNDAINHGSLWRRVLMQSGYQSAGCNGTVPWQVPSCSVGYNVALTSCKTNDIKLLDGVTEGVNGGFKVEYFINSADTNPISNTDSANQSKLSAADIVKVSITAKQNIAGHTIIQTGTMRATSPNNNINLN